MSSWATRKTLVFIFHIRKNQQVIAVHEWIRKLNYFFGYYYLFSWLREHFPALSGAQRMQNDGAKKEGTTAFSDAQSMEWRPELQRAATTPQPKCCKTFPPHSMLHLLLPHLFAKFSHKRQLRKIKLAFSGNGNWVIFSRKTLLFWTAGLRCVRFSFAWPLLLQQL